MNWPSDKVGQIHTIKPMLQIRSMVAMDVLCLVAARRTHRVSGSIATEAAGGVGVLGRAGAGLFLVQPSPVVLLSNSQEFQPFIQAKRCHSFLNHSCQLSHPGVSAKMIWAKGGR